MKKHLKSVFFCVICIIIVTSSFIINKTNNNKSTATNQKSIIELWHIDTFEGGKGSRKDFLLNASLAFEKKYNVIVSVISHTIESAKKCLENSQPDLISCGGGIDIANYVKSIPIKDSFNICNIGKKNYGISWCRGGYALIGSGKKDTLIVSQGEYNLPLMALKESKQTFTTIICLPPQKAFTEYIKKGGYLLGTQRDIIRLISLEKEVVYEPISQFCDLFQVICITSNNKKNIPLCEKYISFLLTDKVQAKLERIGMFSTTGLSLYKNTQLEKLEENKINSFINFFTSSNILKIKNDNLKQELKTS